METMEELKALYKESFDRYNELMIKFKEAQLVEADMGYEFENMMIRQYASGLSVEACLMHVLSTGQGNDVMADWRRATLDKLGIETELKMAATACSYYYTLLNTYPEKI
jgi:hypothetical protein